MSVVYRGERVEGGFGQRVAVKLIALPVVMTEAMARQIQGRFEAERQIVARLEHPDICRLLDGGVTEGGIPYLVLEYVEGKDLVEATAGWGERERVRLLARVARVVHYAHQRLVVHRDLKPSNIMVTGEGHPKLLDFGIAKTLDEAEWGMGGEKTATVFRAATPGYASPEQLRGEALTTATDIYSLGVVARKVLREGVKGDLAAIVGRATREEAGERYPSAAALAGDLERYLEGLPLEARQGQLRYIAAKYVKRHKAAVVVAGVALALAVGFTGLTVVQKRQIAREQQRAEEVARFLRGLFQASDPAFNLGAIPSTRELLDRGAQRMRGSVEDEETRLALMETMAGAYSGLGLYEKSNGMYEEIAGVLEKRGSEGAGRLARVYAEMAEGAAQLGHYEEAMKWGERGVAAARALRPADAGVEAVALEKHCLAYALATKHGEAAPLCKEAAEKAEGSGLTLREQARILRNHGIVLKDLTEYGEAEKAFQRSLTLARSDARADGPTVAVTLTEMGSLYFREGKFEAAKGTFEEAIGLQRRLYPEGHLFTARTLNNLANTRATMRQFEEAEKTYREAHVLYRKFVGEDSGELATSLSNMAVTQQSAGRMEEAGETLRAVMEMHARGTGKGQRPYLSTLLKYANLRVEQGRSGEAVGQAREAVGGFDRLTPVPKLEAGFARVVLAAALIESGRAREAAEPARAGREILSAILQPTHWMRYYADVVLGVALAARGRREEGRALIEPVYELQRHTKSTGAWRARWIEKMWKAYWG